MDKDEIRNALKKDFRKLYVKEYTTNWEIERLVREVEIDVMGLDNILSLIDPDEIKKRERWVVGEELCILIGNTMLKDTKAGILLGEQLRDYMNHYLKGQALKGEQ